MKNLILPFSFVLLYGSGFVFTQEGLEHSSAMAFLAIRFFIAFFILLIITEVFKMPWPENIKDYFHIATSGVLTVGVFSLGVFLSIEEGLSASNSALIIALQPMVVALLALIFLKEKISFKMVLGFILGFLGVCFVVFNGFNTSNINAILYSFLALFGLSFGNLYQKKYCSKMNLFSGGAIQTLSSSLLILPFLYFEDIRVNFNMEFIQSLLYMSICVSIGALSLLYILLKKGELNKVASIFYLMPVCAVLISFFFFNKEIDFKIFIGIWAILFALLLINKNEKKCKG